jgi:hypothetical protein
MKRTHIVSLMALVVAVPAATAGSFFSSSAKPCFVAGNAGYELSGSAKADYTVRIDNTAPNPSLRMQLVDDPAAADFVLVDDGDAAETCKATSTVNSIRVDPAAAHPDLTVALSRTEANYKIYVRSANYTEQDAAALFAVIWQNTRKTGQISHPGRAFAETR